MRKGEMVFMGREVLWILELSYWFEQWGWVPGLGKERDIYIFLKYQTTKSPGNVPIN